MAEKRDETFQQAARGLRSHLHYSQQFMATFLGLSMAALRNYESGAVTDPDARAATAYMLAAEMKQRPDLVEVFRSALYRALGIEQPLWKRSEVAAEDETTPLRILARMGELRTHPMAKTLFLEPVNDLENCMIRTLLACIRGQGPFKKYQESILQALVRPSLTIDDEYPELLLLKKEELSDQLMAFEKAATPKRQTRKERTSE